MNIINGVPWWACLVILCGAILFCEFVGDYFKLWSCSWPHSSNGKELTPETGSLLRAIILADTHLLGSRRGHWLDKLYREWHMRSSFQAAMTLHKPDVVFVLGDLFDEGELADHAQFREYVRRFHSHFRTPPDVPIVSAVGNHDIGFHYKMHPYFVGRFEKHFNNTGVRLYTIGGLHFVFVNSMAMANDGCYFCETAIKEFHAAKEKLECLRSPNLCTTKVPSPQHERYSRPVLMQHFPTYRRSDKECRERDSPTIEQYRENWEVLSKNSTDWLGKLLLPRVAFAGHSHHYCFNINRWGVEEYTVASFNWRNKVDPSFLMVSFTASEHAVMKCNMLEQQTVYNIYLIAISSCVAMFIWQILQWFCVKRTFQTQNKHRN